MGHPSEKEFFGKVLEILPRPVLPLVGDREWLVRIESRVEMREITVKVYDEPPGVGKYAMLRGVEVG